MTLKAGQRKGPHCKFRMRDDSSRAKRAALTAGAVSREVADDGMAACVGTATDQAGEMVDALVCNALLIV